MLSSMNDAENRSFVLLCDGCATEVGANDEEHLVPPTPELDGAACERCGAIFGGFAYRVPEDAYTGMAPGPG
jgi:hypothetical protein